MEPALILDFKTKTVIVMTFSKKSTSERKAVGKTWVVRLE